ncbi:MAG: hypothetical protein NWR67_07120, partial [Saprospiraceae bacterium]|nr:hypothetical protein [Saprospiraceae bacterium]
SLFRFDLEEAFSFFPDTNFQKITAAKCAIFGQLTYICFGFKVASFSATIAIYTPTTISLSIRMSMSSLPLAYAFRNPAAVSYYLLTQKR